MEYGIALNNLGQHSMQGDDAIVMQYTGLHDSNVAQEYFGDIIEDDDGVRYVIEDGDSAVLFKNIKTGVISFFWHLMKPHRIIGNIYENKELLGEK